MAAIPKRCKIAEFFFQPAFRCPSIWKLVEIHNSQGFKLARDSGGYCTSVPCKRMSTPSWLSSWRNPCSPHSCRPRSVCQRPCHHKYCRNAWTRLTGGSGGTIRWGVATPICQKSWKKLCHFWNGALFCSSAGRGLEKADAKRTTSYFLRPTSSKISPKDGRYLCSKICSKKLFRINIVIIGLSMTL